MTLYRCPKCAREHTVNGKIAMVICPGCTTKMEVKEIKTNIEEHAELNPFLEPRSSIKIKKTTRGLTWDIKIVSGEEHLIEGLMVKAVGVHKKLGEELK